MKILNLGCGVKISQRPEVINVDWSIYLRLKKNPLLRRLAPLVLSKERRARFEGLPANIMVHDLSKGLPFSSGSIDVVYHSHFLEHLDRDAAEAFLLEVRRVLAPAGVQRIVVPDLEMACRAYLSHLLASDADPKEARHHDDYIAAILEQSVRREAFGSSQQRPLLRLVENMVLGDARRRGETHQWMYDWVNLRELLTQLGYGQIERHLYDTSDIPQWNEIGLDVDSSGEEYKRESLYVEARAPAAP